MWYLFITTSVADFLLLLVLTEWPSLLRFLLTGDTRICHGLSAKEELRAQNKNTYKPLIQTPPKWLTVAMFTASHAVSHLRLSCYIPNSYRLDCTHPSGGLCMSEKNLGWFVCKTDKTTSKKLEHSNQNFSWLLLLLQASQFPLQLRTLLCDVIHTHSVDSSNALASLDLQWQIPLPSLIAV